MGWCLLIFGIPIIWIIGLFVCIGITMHKDGIGMSDFNCW